MSSMSPVELYIDLSIIDIVFIYLYIIALIHEFLRFWKNSFELDTFNVISIWIYTHTLLNLSKQ